MLIVLSVAHDRFIVHLTVSNLVSAAGLIDC